MSKNTARKGIAFGAMVALGASLLAGAPAQANTSGPLTLTPNGVGGAGATYTSLIGAGLTLSSVLDGDKQKPAVAAVYRDVKGSTQALDAAVRGAVGDDTALAIAVSNYNAASTVSDISINTGANPGDDTVTGLPAFWTADAQTSTLPVAAVDPLARHYYIVENAAGAAITITLTSDTAVDNYYLFDVDGDATGPYTSDQTGTDFTDGGANGNSFVTTAKKIAVSAAVGGTAGSRTVSPLKVDVTNANATSSVKVKVTSLTDTLATGSTQIAKINNGEWRSATQEVTLLPAASVAVKTAMSGTTDRTGSNVDATVTIGSSVNPYAVAGSFGVVYYADGSNITLGTAGTSDAVSGAVEYFATASGNVNTDTGAIVASATADGDFLTGGNLESAVYTARAIYLPTTPDIYAGARSVALDLRDGTNATVDGAEVTFTASNDVAVVADNNAVVREGVKSVAVVGQIQKAAGDYAAAGVRVRATVTGVTVDADSTITVSGSADEIVEAADSITVFGFSNSDGEFPITITSTTGEDLDQVQVTFAALLANGTYASGDTETVTWQTPALEADLEVSPSAYLTGATVNVTFTAVDQFGVGMDSTDTGRVSIRVDAYVDGAVKTATYSETKATTNGAASFSFANFATAGSNQEIKVTVFQASTAGTPAYYTVYNNVATSAIAIADVFSNRVQYVDAVTGSTAAAATLKSATDAGVIAAFGATAGIEFANIVGTALDANNAGQPGVPVTIAAEGVLFHDAETKTLALDSITVIANGQGFFDVQALSHKVNVAGATVTVTAGGVTETTLLKSYLATDIDAKNLQFSWSLPAYLVKNTTYSVVATLTDVWGNPLQTLKTNTNNGGTAVNADALAVAADGSLQVNGVATVARNFNNKGQATVFVRSVTDVAGPGALSASVGSLNYYTGGATAEIGRVDNTTDVFTTDVVTTSWNETTWSDTLSIDVDVLDAAPAADQKVNAGSFKGYVALYAKGYKGSKMTAIVAGKWLAVNSLASDYERVVRYTGAGYDIVATIYIDGVKIETFNLTTK